VTIRQATDIETLYDEVQEYDLVVTPDAPLGHALGNRLDHARIGRFADTPDRLATGPNHGGNRHVFLILLREMDVSYKEAAWLTDTILGAWEETGDVDAILAHDRFDTATIQDAIAVVADTRCTQSALADHRIDDDLNVAVIGESRLNALERSVLPADYDPIDPFTDEAFDPPTFRIFDSATAIVDTLLETITADTAEDVAVVVDRGSTYATVLEAGLDAADVPYQGGPGFADQPDHRNFVRLLRAALGGSDLRVGEVASLLQRLGADVPIDHDDKRLFALDPAEVPELAWFQEFASDLATTTFDGALAAYEAEADTTCRRLREELDLLGLLDATVTDGALDDFTFYLQSYDVPVDRDDDGVLLADATSAAYVDRPTVFYLGLDAAWTRTPPDRPWVDGDAHYDRSVEQFQLMLQNGQDQYYLVVDSKAGEPVTPCLYFEDLLDDEFERFSDLPSEPRSRTFREAGDGFSRDEYDVEPESVSTISQSTLNELVNCPRAVFFDDLVDDPDKDYFTEGQLYHDFAEYYATHPEDVDDATVDRVVDVIADEVTPYVREVDTDLRRTRYRLGIEVLMDYIDATVPEDHSFAPPDTSWTDNRFADEFGKPVDSPLTEQWFDDDALGIKGMIDLVVGPTALADYKKGSKKSASQVVDRSSLDPIHEKANYHAMLYLTKLRDDQPGAALWFTFVHFTEPLNDALAGDYDMADVLTTVEYHPTTLGEYIARESVFDALVEDGAKDCRKTFDQFDYETYRSFLDSHDLPDFDDSDDLIDSDFGQVFITELQSHVGDYKYVVSGCEQAMREFARINARTYFEPDLDAFETFVQDRLADLNGYRTGEGRWPVEGPDREPNFDRVDNRDLILTDD
jgi:hypothetical protein